MFRFGLLFFFNDTATTEIYTLSLHDALPISREPARRSRRRAGQLARHARVPRPPAGRGGRRDRVGTHGRGGRGDRESTPLNSSHVRISYAVFCLTKNMSWAMRRISTPTWPPS